MNTDKMHMNTNFCLIPSNQINNHRVNDFLSIKYKPWNTVITIFQVDIKNVSVHWGQWRVMTTTKIKN